MGNVELTTTLMESGIKGLDNLIDHILFHEYHADNDWPPIDQCIANCF